MIRKFLILTALVTLPIVGNNGEAHAAEEYCREYTKTVTVGGQREQAYGTACYKPDGSWEIVSTQGSDYGRSQVRDVIVNDAGRDYRTKPYYNVNVVERRYYRPHYNVKTYRSYQKPSYVRNAYYHRYYDDHKHKYKKHKKYKKGKGHHKHHGYR